MKRHVAVRRRRVWAQVSEDHRQGKATGVRRLAKELAISTWCALNDLRCLGQLGYVKSPPAGKLGVGWTVLIPLVEGRFVCGKERR